MLERNNRTRSVVSDAEVSGNAFNSLLWLRAHRVISVLLFGHEVLRGIRRIVGLQALAEPGPAARWGSRLIHHERQAARADLLEEVVDHVPRG